jgi:phosphoribosylaminoimidazolecarboxamide formyltransferase/IMP cyclohydrolase
MRALVSVSDKTNLVPFVKGLVEAGYEIIATGGTMKLLKENGVNTINIEDVTGFPEICEGRVKTLHPKVHGGLLAKRDSELHMSELKENGIELIDLVCVNLYPFKKTIEKENVTLAEAIENIDIGGPSMLRSGAKNFASVTVVCDPTDYSNVLEEIKANGNTSYETRFKLAAKVYTHTAEYDTMIAKYMREKAELNEKLFIEADLVQGLRYGENPHQNAKFFAIDKTMPFSLAGAKQLHGKELSYNNIQDANAALQIVAEFDEPFVVGLKHMNPCGAAIGENVADAWTKAYNADSVSIYGGIVATNQVVTEEVALLMKPVFLELILAPSFTPEALKVFEKKKNIRLIEVNMTKDNRHPLTYTAVTGGILVQDSDNYTTTKTVTMDMTVTEAKPTEAELKDLNFAWRIVKHVKSNAIVVVKNQTTAGVGAGQMNRIGSAKLAIEEAHALGLTEGLVLASDGFFPFNDTVKYAIENGVTAIVQPGGSVRDEDSIVAANAASLPMLCTGMRHFKH